MAAVEWIRNLPGVDGDTEAVREVARGVLTGGVDWAQVRELGWLGLALPESEGGFGPEGVHHRLALVEEAGRALVAAPVLSTLGLAAGVLLECTDAEPARRALAGIADGAAAALVGHAPAAESPLRVEDGRLRGSAAFVLDAEKADLLVVLAESASGGCVVALRRDQVVVEQTAAIEPARPLATVHCDAAVPAEAVVPLPRESALTAPRLAIAAELVGVASATLELGVEYAGQRVQFGRTIGEFQAVQHRLASAYVLVERARGAVAAAAVAGSRGTSSDERRLASFVAKAAASDAAVTTLNSVVQVHGAIGTTAEHGLHRLMRRIWQNTALLGEAHELYAEIGAHAATAAREGAGWRTW